MEAAPSSIGRGLATARMSVVLLATATQLDAGDEAGLINGVGHGVLQMWKGITSDPMQRRSRNDRSYRDTRCYLEMCYVLVKE